MLSQFDRQKTQHITVHLFQAALLSGEAARSPFHAWQSSVNLDDIPPSQHALLPLLYRNLEPLDIDHPWLPRLRGIYRRTWYANQVALRSLAEVVETLDAASLPVLVVGTAALASTVYSELALRPIYVPEIIVSSEAVDESIQTLNDLGWRPDPSSPHLHSPEFRTWVADQRFVNEHGQAMQLYWHVLPVWPSADADADLWSLAIPLVLNDITTQTLDPTDQLLRVCSAAAEHRSITLVDAALLIQTADIDWQRLHTLAARYHLTLPVALVMEQLTTILDLDIPSEVMVALRDTAVSSYEQRELLVGLTPPTQRSLAKRFWMHYARYRRIADCQKIRPDLRHFQGYLQHTRGLECVTDLYYQGFHLITAQTKSTITHWFSSTRRHS